MNIYENSSIFWSTRSVRKLTGLGVKCQLWDKRVVLPSHMISCVYITVVSVFCNHCIFTHAFVVGQIVGKCTCSQRPEHPGFLPKKNIAALDHPTYSPDFAPYDFSSPF